jgi:hypothetical protein
MQSFKKFKLIDSNLLPFFPVFPHISAFFHTYSHFLHMISTVAIFSHPPLLTVCCGFWTGPHNLLSADDPKPTQTTTRPLESVVESVINARTSWRPVSSSVCNNPAPALQAGK